MTVSTKSQGTANGNVYVGIYNLESINTLEPRWSELSTSAKRRALEYVKPDREIRTSNTTTIGLDEYRALNLDQTREVNDSPDEIAVGDDDTEPEHENRDLNNELGRVTIDEYTIDGPTIFLNAFVPPEAITEDNDGNTPDLVELGVVSAGNRLFNHALFEPVEKQPYIAIQFEVSITFDTADDVPDEEENDNDD